MTKGTNNFKLETCAIQVSEGESANFGNNQLLSLKYTEDIKRASIHVELRLTDSQTGVLSILQGMERVTLCYSDHKGTTLTHELVIYDIQDRTSSGSKSKATLMCCSPEFIDNAAIKLSKRYGPGEGKQIHEIVKDDLLVKILGIAEDRINFTPTKNKFSFISPFWSPFTAIAWLCARAIPSGGSGKNASAGYCFFENYRGYNFLSYDSFASEDELVRFVVDLEEDEFDDWDNETEDNDEKYWFTKDKIDKISEVHNYLDGLPQVGKVLSFSSIIDVATQLNNNKPLGTLEMGVLYSKIPNNIKKEIIDPYISVDDNEARINLRIIDSQENLRRNDLIKKIRYDLKNKFSLKETEFKLAGVLILFNNLLQSLFKSQILTLGLVMIGIFVMFLILFRNIKLSLIGVVPNFIAAFFILGIIGLLNIPLDMMTITIAAITIGIAVDNSIHYIYRFKEEFHSLNDYSKTIKSCHATVGRAILNTSITIVFGFSILVLSKFIPTILFGIFTGLAMLLAMISVLTLMPALILKIKPFENN